MFRCGAYETILTPPLGSGIPGQFADRRLSGVKDELYAKAIVIEAGGDQLIWISVDALFVMEAETKRIRERIEAYTGIPPERVMVSATHIHTGGPIWPGQDEAYAEQLAQKAADAAILAWQRLRPARIGFGKGEVPGIAFNRRYRMKDGSVRTNPGYANPDIDAPEGPADPEAVVVRLDEVNGGPIAVITNFACHPDTVGGTEACADYPGALSVMLKRALGEPLVSLFLQGASGNVNHHDFSRPRAIAPDHYRRMGTILAGEVIRIRETCSIVGDAEQPILGAERVLLPLVYRQPTEAEMAQAQRMIQDESVAGTERTLAERVLESAQHPVRETEVELQAFRIGEWAAVGLPGELFSELGLALKAESPYNGLIVNTICNGTQTGYVGTMAAFANGGYEARIRPYSRVPAGTGEWFVEEGLRLLRRLRE